MDKLDWVLVGIALVMIILWWREGAPLIRCAGSNCFSRRLV
jgi:hypothetical protein